MCLLNHIFVRGFTLCTVCNDDKMFTSRFGIRSMTTRAARDVSSLSLSQNPILFYVILLAPIYDFWNRYGTRPSALNITLVYNVTVFT